MQRQLPSFTFISKSSSRISCKNIRLFHKLTLSHSQFPLSKQNVLLKPFVRQVSLSRPVRLMKNSIVLRWRAGKNNAPTSWRHEIRDTRTRFLPAKEDLVVYGFLALNVGVYCLWWSRNTVQFDRWMVNNFTVTWRNLQAGRYWTLLTSNFSQAEIFHLMVNVFVLWNWGRTMTRVIGIRRFVTLYLLGGVTCCLTHIAHQHFYMPTITGYVRDTPALGASGAIFAIMTTAVCLAPQMKLAILFFPVPVPGWMLLAAFVGYDAYKALEGGEGGRVAHAGHVGGALFGVLYYLAVLRRGGLRF